MATIGTVIEKDVLLTVQNVSKTYGEGRGDILVLDDVTLQLRAGEFVALLGPSGSGKSTLLRILAGLLSPSKGDVLVHDAPLHGTNPNVAMVFQSFALYPWLTVQANVELGLLALNVDPSERRKRALRAIDLIGLDGFEDAYPKELSGGMRQRVGFARALVVEPEVLLLDEPFSALDVLTADNLRHELVALWQNREIPTKAILMVTHNIAEAVELADRLLVFEANPGRIRLELAGDARSEQGRNVAHRAALVDTIYRVMTNPREDVGTLLAPVGPVKSRQKRPTYQTLPHISIGDLSGLLERLQEGGGRADLAVLAEDLHLEADELLPLAEAADLLGFADIEEGDVILTSTGRRFVAASVLGSKEIFRNQALGAVELIRQIVRDLAVAPNRRLPEDQILQSIEAHFSEEEARRQLDTAIDWGRYAELFAYDDSAGAFYLEDASRRR